MRPSVCHVIFFLLTKYCLVERYKPDKSLLSPYVNTCGTKIARIETRRREVKQSLAATAQRHFHLDDTSEEVL